ncbi:MAG TPA: LysR family transcriptional regulator [Candidatus Saccharimonadales bacterium]|nr:LysR family transcriptional regulator [Candidatus Saccharimonadales bacterium]
MEERLRKFVRLVEAGNFVRAAHELHISQPALSAAIAKLERELHTPLLLHGVRPLTLTPAGELAYVAGKDLQVRTNNLQTQLAELGNRRLTVSIGMIDSVAEVLFGSAGSIANLERQAAVSLVVDNSRNLLQATQKGALDVAFVVAQPAYDGVLEIMQRSTEPLFLVCHPAGLESTNQAIAQGLLPKFISYDQASTTHRLVLGALARHGLSPQPTFYSTSPEAMLQLVLLQKGAAVLPYVQVRGLLADGSLVLAGHEPLLVERPIRAIKRRDRILPSPLTRTVREITTQLHAIQAVAQFVSGKTLSK